MTQSFEPKALLACLRVIDPTIVGVKKTRSGNIEAFDAKNRTTLLLYDSSFVGDEESFTIGPRRVPHSENTINPDGWFRRRDEPTTRWRITSVSATGVTLQGRFVTWQQLLDEWTIDGEIPAGRLVQ